MKKINLAIVCMAAAAMASCCGSVSAPKVSMNDVNDTLSYSIGLGRAVHIYKGQLPEDVVDSTTMNSFLKGFLEAAKNTDDKQTLAYAFGVEIGNQEMSQVMKGLSNTIYGDEDAINAKNYMAGFIHGITGNDDIMTFEEADETANRLYEFMIEQRNNAAKLENQAFLEAKALEDGVVKSPSGLLYEVISKGDGTIKPTENSTVLVNYHGELIDGTVFDESKEPTSLNLASLIPGFTEGIMYMSVGDKFRLYIPSELAYGEQSAGKVKPNSTLIFDVELVSVN